MAHPPNYPTSGHHHLLPTELGQARFIGLNRRRVLAGALSTLGLGLTACGGGGGDDPSLVAPGQALLTKESPVATRIFVRDPFEGIAEQAEHYTDEWSYSVRHQGKDIVAADLGGLPLRHLTGLELNDGHLREGGAQRGNGRGAAFQSYRGKYGSYIDTRTFAPRRVEGGGPHSAVAFAFKDMPRMLDGLDISAILTNQLFEQAGGAVAQLSLVGYMVDDKGNLIAFVFPVFDNRMNSYPSVAASDRVVSSFVSEPPQNQRYATLLSDARMQSSLFQDTFLKVTFTEQNLAHIVQDVNEFNARHGDYRVSENLGTYRLLLIGVLHEVFVDIADPQAFVASGVSFRDIRVQKIPARA